ncbi:helix-turn-helix domain-containing protein [Streptomyces sp. AVP053U2]|uniref:helix-turn-helix domain-containing protein n=1 Tax=Streptomyces sp. AVP053U2 TaxID=1737066 RepID=UPI001C404305|nr:helix-turn-helix domain-containing protein [Streptomyces sp. AVP053U2]
MSTRNFSRRFHGTTGMSPAKWILTRRLDEARRLLETTTWSITRVSAACGFASAVTFRQNFTAHYATTPTSYRHRFTDHTAATGSTPEPSGPRTEGTQAQAQAQAQARGHRRRRSQSQPSSHAARLSSCRDSGRYGLVRPSGSQEGPVDVDATAGPDQDGLDVALAPGC